METEKTGALMPFDAADYLETPEDIALYLDAVLEEGDAALIAVALGDVARSKGMTAVAREAGVTREALYKALSEKGDPKLSTLLGVLKALGLHLSVKSVMPHDDAA
ncbi:addiction module antidote protein [Martelella limonii]|uniref:addiction module antidote protein n=1 Tax=Martelella limonii TaxID=1647649 RepID=UPI001580BBCC|nr:addiction module antidote protein [Martelella limonii]